MLAAYNYLFNLYEPGKPSENTSENILYKNRQVDRSVRTLFFSHKHKVLCLNMSKTCILSHIYILLYPFFQNAKCLLRCLMIGCHGFSLFSHWLQETSIGGFSYQLFSTPKKAEKLDQPLMISVFSSV